MNMVSDIALYADIGCFSRSHYGPGLRVPDSDLEWLEVDLTQGPFAHLACVIKDQSFAVSMFRDMYVLLIENLRKRDHMNEYMFR